MPVEIIEETSQVDGGTEKRVYKNYGTDDAWTHAKHWYSRREISCVPRAFRINGQRGENILSYRYVEGTMPRDWQAVEAAAREHIWGVVAPRGSVPRVALQGYIEYCITRASVLWSIEKSPLDGYQPCLMPFNYCGVSGPSHAECWGARRVDAFRLAAFIKCMSLLDKERHTLHLCDDVHGDLTLENCIQTFGNECEMCGGAGVIDSGGVQPWGQGINVPCDACNGKGGADRIVFIDPGNSRGLTCIELDQAKLLQSYDGWEAVKSARHTREGVIDSYAVANFNINRPFYGRAVTLLLLSHYVRALCHCERHGEIATRWMLQRVDEIMLHFGCLQEKYL